MFAQVRDSVLADIFGNLNQTVFGEPAYTTAESKAAHLLYFVVKTIRLPMTTSAVAHFCLWVFCIALTACLTQKGIP